MQPIAAYYVYVATEHAREASARERRYRTAAAQRTTRRRFGAALGALVRPLRGAPSAA